MDTWLARRPVCELRPGDHAWLAFSHDEEQDHVVGAFVREGLHAGHKVIYVTDARPADLPGLHGADPQSYLDNGQLKVIAHGDARRGDAFDPDRMLAAVGTEITRAETDGHIGVRVTADLSWTLEGPDGFDRLMYCERLLDAAVAPSTTVMAICQVDRRACPPERLEALGELHEVRAQANPHFEDAVLRITRTFQPRGLSLDGEIDISRHPVFTEALSAVTGNGHEIHLDLAELSFIDLAGLNMLAEFAERRAGHCSLVLDHVPDPLRAVMDVVGWHLLRGLRFGDAA